eukprot:gb/GECG01005078.1/.p1 GENE.gb/GECG01005078.1/~~gb/GECG01005078.1/.p1  ORF type:complete len:296 (+),score=25.81 gb/GECG01005078.1/:1-888(+)
MDNRQHQQYQYGPPQQSQGQPIPQQAPYYMFGGAPVGAPTSAPLYTSSYDPTVAAAGSSSVLGGGMGPPPPAAAAPHGWGEYYAPDGTPYYYNSITQVSQWEKPPELQQYGAAMMVGAPAPNASDPMVYGGHNAVPMNTSLPMQMMMTPDGQRIDPVAGQSYPNAMPLDASNTTAGVTDPGSAGTGVAAPIGPGPPIQKTEHAQGPVGCNLFIFHIPNDMTNRDLYNYFSAYGNVISARIMVERETGRSRGFGFVSFDNREAAENAISGMDGFQIGRKRLKVKHKEERNRQQNAS